MGLLTMLLILLAGCVALGLLFGGYLLYAMFLPTRGRRIESYRNPTSALLVLDIQESGARPGAVPLPVGTPFGRMIETVNRLISCFDATGREVAYIRQVFSGNLITRLHGGRIVAGRMEPVICRWVSVVNSNDFAKNRTDAFSNRQLEQFLIDRQVDELYLVGLDAAFCVYYTALGALNRGYRVTVVSDGVMTRKELLTVLEKYRSRGIGIITSQELLAHFDPDQGTASAPVV